MTRRWQWREQAPTIGLRIVLLVRGEGSAGEIQRAGETRPRADQPRALRRRRAYGEIQRSGALDAPEANYPDLRATVQSVRRGDRCSNAAAWLATSEYGTAAMERADARRVRTADVVALYDASKEQPT